MPGLLTMICSCAHAQMDRDYPPPLLVCPECGAVEAPAPLPKVRELISAYLHAFLAAHPRQTPPDVTRRGERIVVSWTDRAYCEVSPEEMVAATERLRAMVVRK